MVRFHLQWIEWLRQRPEGECYAMSRVWWCAFPDRTLPPLDLRKDDLCRSDKVGESRFFCAPARHSWKACHLGPSWRFHRHAGDVSVSPDQLPGKDILDPLVQEYFKEDIGAASH